MVIISQQIINNLADVKPGDMVRFKGSDKGYKCLDNISDATEPDDGEHWHLQIAYRPHPWENSNGKEWVDDALFDYAVRYAPYTGKD